MYQLPRIYISFILRNRYAFTFLQNCFPAVTGKIPYYITYGLLLSFIICDIKVYSQSEINVHVDIPGTLHEKLPERDNCYIAALKISGSLNEEDLKVVSDWGSDNKKKFDLDLSEAGINTIAYQTFAGSYLRKIILPNTITEIEREAFFKCSYLEYVDFSLCSNLTKIGIKAFAGCSNLILVDLGQCVALKDLQGSQQFDGCLSLRSFILPPNIEVMFTYWFGLFCDNISFLEIPSSVKKMIIEKDGIKNATFKMHTKPELNIWSYPPYGPLFRVPKGTKLSWDNSGISVNEYSSKHYNFKLHYNDEGGVVRIGNRIYKSGENIEIEDWSLFYFYVEPKLGYHVKSTKNIHRTGYKTYSFYNFNFDQEASLEFEKDAPVYLNVNYSEGGSVRVDNKLISSGVSLQVDAFRDIKVDIIPSDGYLLEKVRVKNTNITINDVKNNTLIIPALLSSDKELNIQFRENVYTINCFYEDSQGIVKINDNVVKNGSAINVIASTNVQLSIVPNQGYHLKKVTVGGVDKTSEVRNNQLTITSISKNQEISILFEKDASINYTVKVSYNEGGKIKVNNNFVDNGTITTVTVPADVQLSVVPDKGYHLKQIVVGGVDKTNEVKENQLFFYSISENLEVSVAFEKDVPTSYTLSINRSGSGGYVKVNGQNVGDETISIPASGVILTFVPDETHPEYKYRVHRVTLNGKDITDQIKDNSYTILSPSENLSLYVDFKEIPIYRFTIEQKNGEGGLVKIGDEVLNSFSYSSYIYEGEFLIIQFLENKYFELDKVFLEDDDISDQVENGFLKMKLTSYYNSHITINYKPKKYTLLLTDIQHIEQISKGWESLPLQKNIQIDAGSGLPLWIRANEFYAIVKVLLDGEIVYQVADLKLADNYAQIEHIDMNKDKELTIILKLKEVRALEVDVKEPGTLSSYLSEENIKLATDLYVQGNIDQRDFVIMNQMESLSDLKIRADINKYMDYPANEIPKKAFYNNKTIRSITIPASLESIGTQAFYGSVLNEFTSFDTYMRLKSIGEEAFKDCKYLTDMYYCADIKVIEKGTFENCLNLKQMSSQNVIEIKESAFRNCKNLTFYLDGSLERIGDYAFENVHEVNDNGYYFENPQLSYIGKNALKGCQNESFNFKAYMNLNELPSFEGCSKLTSITLPKNVKQIPVGIFTGCTSLAYVYMSENIEYIAENAFSDCNSLYYLYIPVSKTPEVFNNSFSDLNYQLTKLAVPADYLPFYKNHPVWGNFSVIEPIGQASTYPVEIILSEGGSLKFRINKDDYWQDVNSSYYGTFDSASRIEFFVSPSEGYSIESVYLNGENITESLNDNNGFVIPYLLENTSISVKFKKDDVTSIDSVNADRCIYSIGSNQLILQGFKVGSLIHVYETSGRLIFRSEVQNNEEKIELPNKGIYFIRIGSENIKIAL